MIAEQLQAARTAHWRQQHSPLLTLEDAQNWIGQHPLCLYLPRRAQLPAPAPSFVEACLGNTQATPETGAIEAAQSMLTRLIAAGTVVPLNLMGTVGEQPDFLANAESLPFVISLRADSDWKHAPQKSSGHKVSPLVLELWKLLEQEGSLTAAEARATLGRELTEAAVLRALAELWQGLRISPVYGEDGQPARWEMMRVRHREALTTAAGTGQVTAISLLVSMYLQSVYAATGEEIEIFLSPVTSRSRVREAVRGLSATRQIHSLSMEAGTYYFLENGLPEFATVTVSSSETPAVPLPGRPKRRDHPLSEPGSGSVAASPPRPAVAAPAAAGGGWQNQQRPPRSESAGQPAETWRSKKTADPSAPLRSGRDDKGKAARPGRVVRAGVPPRPGGRDERRTAGTGRPPFKTRSGPPGSGQARTGPPKPGGFVRTGAPPRPSGGGVRPAGAGRPPFKPRSEPESGRPSSGQARSGQARTGQARTGPPRTGGFARTGAAPRPSGGARPAGPGRPPFKPRSERPTSGRPTSGQARTGPPRPGGFVRAGAPPRPGGRGARPAGSGRPPFKPRSERPTSGRPTSGQARTGPPRPGGFVRAGAPPRPGGGGARPAGPGRPPFKPGSERPISGQARSGQARTGPPRPGGFLRTGASRAGGGGARPAGPGRPPFKPRSEEPSSGRPRSGQARSGSPRPGGFARTGAPPRPSGGGARPARPGRPPFKPRSERPTSGRPTSGPPRPRGDGKRPGKSPGDYPRRKPDRKKPGA